MYTGREVCCHASCMSLVLRGIRSLTHLDICFAQQVYYPTESVSKPERLLSCFLCPYWKFIQCKPVYLERNREREREVEREQSLWAFRVHDWAVLCQPCAKETEGREGWKKREKKTSSGEDFTNILYFISTVYNCFIYCSVPWWSMFVSAFINLLLFFASFKG